MNKKKILIVDDEDDILHFLELVLREKGYEVVTASGGHEALTKAQVDRPDLVLLDISLPKRSGLWVLERLREADNHVPVIVLSARQDEFDKVAALRLGADDYITKPFALAELLARVAALLRRVRLSRPAGAGAPAAPAPAVLTFGDVVVDLDARTVNRAGQPVKLTHLEFELLAFLCQNSRRVFSREELVRQVWGFQQVQVRTVDNFVAQLRAKLETHPDRPRHLLTVRGSGYRFVPE